MPKKSFFHERTASKIRKLRLKQEYTQRGLVNKILDLDPTEDGIELRVRITPGNFFAGHRTGKDASSKCFRHGNLMALSQPKRQKDAYASDEYISDIFLRDLKRLSAMKEDDINYIGYSFRPVQGADRTKRVVPFAWVPEGHRIYAYAENMASGIGVNFDAEESKRVAKEGAVYVCGVPSRTEKHQKYVFKLMHVPIRHTLETMAVVWSFRPGVIIDPETWEPVKGRTNHDIYNIKFNFESEREGSEVITLYPHDIAAYFKIALKLWNEEKNMVPFSMSPFPVLSRRAIDFYRRLYSNLLVYDPTISGKEKTRKLHVDEKCILMARCLGILGPEESLWDKERDGKIKDYDWVVSRQDSRQQEK